MHRIHRTPFGAEPGDAGGIRFRIWAPAAKCVALCLESGPARPPLAMEPEPNGWYAWTVADAGPGTRYRFLIDSKTRVPDPASRFQPEDVHGPSEVIEPRAFAWTDEAWRGRPWRDAVIYELHVGAFTRAGTFVGVAEKLDHLAALGVTAIELMPVAQAPGRRNWGYDGAYAFAPNRAYGRPDDLKALINAAHTRGLMVLLDVVYNHFGPDGNYMHLYAPQFFTDRHKTPWGDAINFDGGFRPVREFFIHNALYWILEFHLDGLRLDAVHSIVDESSPHILNEIADAVHAAAGEGRHVHLVLENDDNEARYLERDAEGDARLYAAQWNDDVHHALHVLLTGEREGYYADYADAPIRYLGRALTEGFAYQGEASAHRGGAARGTPSGHLPATAFVAFLQNHDQIGNRAFGERIVALADADAVRAALAVLLLAPSPPLLFMGEEWGARQPFPFFCDFGPELADAVRQGRRAEFARFAAFHDEAARARIPDPNDPATFAQAVLDWSEAAPVRLDFVRELLDLRKREIVPRLDGLTSGAGKFEVHGTHVLSARWHLTGGEHLWLGANLGPAALARAPPPQGRAIYVLGREAWSVTWAIA